ncbi:glycosyltransferase family 2 protein [Segetibacter aerophilus]|nr:glycosyltransferase family 2 protein [Segetibacter aerophilus]
MKNPAVSVIMPTYKHELFIRRAIASLLEQSFTDWELIIINDGSPDNTEETVQPFLQDKRIRYYRNKYNKGLGACLNFGMSIAFGSYITYLPSDDVIYVDHLQSLLDVLEQNEGAVLAYSSIRHHYNRSAKGVVNDEWLQLVQVMHRKTEERWLDRKELESDDLNRLFWNKLQGERVLTNQLTCEWVDHPNQRYKIMQEPIGGINTFRSYYNIGEPLIYHTTKGNFMNEVERYAPYRERVSTPLKENGLKILLVGELAYNAERVLALEEQGHKLFGLWMEEPYWYNYVGPLPFDHVEDISKENWEEEIKRIKPDVIYALLNWQAVPLCHEVLKANTGIPFVWHFKEGPFICLEKGTWNEMIELYNKADGRIYTSEEMKWWLDDFITKEKHSLDYVLDGDLPKKDWFDQPQSKLLSESTPGEFHTVVPGRPIGLHPHTVVELAAQKIHVHFYGDFTHGQWKQWIEKTQLMAPGFLHIHPNVDQENWVKEFSQYDAGWLHFFQSENRGEVKRSNWDDLNIPARMATLALAGVPMLQRDNAEHIVAIQSVVKKLEIGLLFDDMEELGRLMRNKTLMSCLRENTWSQRQVFMFDTHVEDLVQFFRQVIQNFKNKEAIQTNKVEPQFSATHQRAASDKTYYSQPQPL